MKFKNTFKIIRISLFSLAIWPLTIWALPGCGGDSEPEEPRQLTSLTGNLNDPPGPQPKIKPLTKAEQQAELKKWNTYVDLSNELETSFQPAMRAYFTAYGQGPEYKLPENPQTPMGFRETMNNPGQLTALSEEAWQLCLLSPKRSQVKEASPPEAPPEAQAEQKPKPNSTTNFKDNLDQAAAKLLIQFRPLWNNLVVASKKLPIVETSPEATPTPTTPGFDPQVLHTKIYESYHNFMVAHSHFQAVLNQAALTRRKQDIQEMKQRGLIVRAAMLELIDTGQALQNTLNSRNIISSITLGDTDLNELFPLFNNFQKSIDTFETTLRDPQQLDREKLKRAAVVEFTQQLTVVKASATGLIARLQLQTVAEPFSEKTPGTPDHFAQELGSLVDQYNAIVE